MSSTLKIKLLRESSQLPFQKSDEDAGYDLYYCGTEGIFIDAGQGALIPTGISTSFDKEYVLEIKNRSSVASKKSLIVGAHIVDSGYRGEIFVNLHNVSNKSQIVKPGERVAQFLFYKIEHPILLVLQDLEESSRGVGGFGSTGQ